MAVLFCRIDHITHHYRTSMLLFYGARSKFLKSFPLPGEVCPQCNKADTTQLEIYSRYVHIFGIPTLPIKKQIFSVCLSCKFTRTQKNFPASYTHIVAEKKQLAQAPWYLFLGSILLAALIGVGLFADYSAKQDTARFLANPAVGDVYVYKMENEFIPSKIVSIDGDIIYFVNSNYGYKNDYNIKRAEFLEPDYFSTSTVSDTKDMMKKDFDAKKITKIFRP